MAANTKLTYTLITKFVNLIKKGLTKKIACKACGISEFILYEWIKDAKLIESYLERGNELEEYLEIDVSGSTVIVNYCKRKHKLYKLIANAEAEYIEKVYQIVDDSALKDKDVGSARWILERKDRKAFGANNNFNIGNVDGEPFKTDVNVKPLVEELLEFRELIKKVTLGSDVSNKYKNTSIKKDNEL